MAVDIFLKLTDIPGESRDDKHRDEIDILSYSWGLASDSGTQAAGTGAGTGKADFQDFSFTMPVSKASPKLFLACASGRHVEEATLTVRKAGDKPLEFLVYKLFEVLVTQYQQGASAEEPLDQFALNFSKIEIEYKEQKEDGSFGASTRAGWDLKQNRET